MGQVFIEEEKKRRKIEKGKNKIKIHIYINTSKILSKSLGL
jgi:hypothetical protein